MKTVVINEVYGKIEYEESFWTGRKKLSLNDVPLTKVSKNVFQNDAGEQFCVRGNFFTGVGMIVGSDTVPLIRAVKWYEVLLSVLPFVLILVWGNVPQLCRIVPVVGGAIGGGVSAVFSLLNLFMIKGIKSVGLKILLSIVFLGVTFVVCFGIACAILGALQ